MAKTFAEVTAEVQAIKNETAIGANTAQRVGAALVDILERTKEATPDNSGILTPAQLEILNYAITSMSAEVERGGALVIYLASELGSETLRLPLATPDNDGIMSRADKSKLGEIETVSITLNSSYSAVTAITGAEIITAAIASGKPAAYLMRRKIVINDGVAYCAAFGVSYTGTLKINVFFQPYTGTARTLQLVTDKSAPTPADFTIKVL